MTLEQAHADALRAVASLVRLAAPDNLPEKYGELIDRESVAVIALRIRDCIDVMAGKRKS